MAFTIQDIDDGLLDPVALPPPIDIPKLEQQLKMSCNSVLCRQVIQICKHWKIKTINVVRRDEHVEELKAIGADEVINSSTEDVVKRVKQITKGAGAYAAIDAVGGMLTKGFLIHLVYGQSMRLNWSSCDRTAVSETRLINYYTGKQREGESRRAEEIPQPQPTILPHLSFSAAATISISVIRMTCEWMTNRSGQ